jgi:predicted MFS family arabinose efflux permease
MTWETLHVAIVTFYLQRFYLIVYLSILLIAYGFAQSFGSVLAGQLVKKYRANRVLAVFMAIVAVDGKFCNFPSPQASVVLLTIFCSRRYSRY